MARRLDERTAFAELPQDLPLVEANSGSGPTADCSRILSAIEDLPEEEREAFDLVRIQGLSQSDAAGVLGVSVMTVNRRLHRGLQRLSESLADLYPADEDVPTPGAPDPPVAGGGAP